MPSVRKSHSASRKSQSVKKSPHQRSAKRASPVKTLDVDMFKTSRTPRSVKRSATRSSYIPMDVDDYNFMPMDVDYGSKKRKVRKSRLSRTSKPKQKRRYSKNKRN